MTAIYARQSIDKKDSISIETQIDACKRCCDGEFKVYSDKGWSGKNLDRPQFRRLLADIKSGGIEKLVVYKLDRISRSLNDFSNLMEVFKKYGVEFASTVETFDTSTAIGRAMLGIIMVFAELERLITEHEGIQQELDRLGGSGKPKLLYGDIIPLLDSFAEMPLETRRDIAGQFIGKVLLWEDRLEIQWKF